MNEPGHSVERRVRGYALAAALGIHLLAGLVAVLVYLEEPEKEESDRTIALSFEAPAHESTAAPDRRGEGPVRASRTAPPSVPALSVPVPVSPEALEDLPVVTETVPAIRERFSQELLSSMSQEEAFDSLMTLLDEFPQFRETIVRKMVAGKGIDRIPDLYVSTGIMDYHKNMKFKSKYEYELMRQYHMYGPHHDPVNGPWGYKKTGPQVNMIELVRWLVDLIGGKK